MSKVVASFQAQVTLRDNGDVVEGKAPVQAPTIAEFERILEEALGSYKATFGVDEINVSATRTDR